MMHRSLYRSALIALFAASMVGCRAKAVRGGAGTDNPNLDEGAMSTALDRVDLGHLMQENMQRLIASPLWSQWKSEGKQPILAIWPVKNDTTEHIGPQLLTLLSDMETELINSGVVTVISRERQNELVTETQTQASPNFDQAKVAQIGRQIGANYFITGKIQSVDELMRKERRVQYTLFMQVLEVETGAIRFQTKSERTKAIVR